MNELLQKHGCSNVFTIPEGLKELMADISREVLRDQPPKIFDYIANYLSVLMITREHGIMAVKILDDLCDCRPSVSEHLLQLGVEKFEATVLAQIIKEEIESLEPTEGKEKVKEAHIIKKILGRMVLGEEMVADVCQVARNAYREYWYRKKLLEKELKVRSDEPWEIAAERTLALYKRTKPSYSELTRATQKIQAAYRGYHVRRNLLRHLKPKAKKQPKVALPGPPLDIADSREIDLGPVIKLNVRDEDTTVMFDEAVGESLHITYDPMKTITHVAEDITEDDLIPPSFIKSTVDKRKSVVKPGSDSQEVEVMSQRSRMVSLMPKDSEFQPSRAISQASTADAASARSRMISVMPEGAEIEPSRAVSQAATADATSARSRMVSVMPEGAEIDPIRTVSRAVSQAGDVTSQKSRIASEMPEDAENQPNRSASQMGTEVQLIHKISFAEQPVEVPPEGEVPEDISVAAPEPAEGDVPEVPEDIPDDRTEPDSVPDASILSSAPDTANTTDVDNAGDTTEEEGGE